MSYTHHVVIYNSTAVYKDRSKSPIVILPIGTGKELIKTAYVQQMHVYIYDNVSCVQRVSMCKFLAI